MRVDVLAKFYTASATTGAQPLPVWSTLVHGGSRAETSDEPQVCATIDDDHQTLNESVLQKPPASAHPVALSRAACWPPCHCSRDTSGAHGSALGLGGASARTQITSTIGVLRTPGPPRFVHSLYKRPLEQRCAMVEMGGHLSGKGNGFCDT